MIRNLAKWICLSLLMTTSLMASDLAVNIDPSLSDYQAEKITQASAAIHDSLNLSIKLIKDIQLILHSEIESAEDRTLNEIWKNTFQFNDPENVLIKFTTLQQKMASDTMHIRYGSTQLCQTDHSHAHPNLKTEKVAFVLMLKDNQGNLIAYDVDHQQKNDGSAIIYLCDGWFKQANIYAQIATLIHELSHWYLNTKDFAYVFENKKLTPKQRLNNADTYALFVYYALKFYEALKKTSS